MCFRVENQSNDGCARDVAERKWCRGVVLGGFK